MIALRGERVSLRTLEREDCRALWAAYEPADPLPTEPLRPGLSIEGADRWFDDMQRQQGREQVYLGIWSDDGRLVGDIQISAIDWQARTATLGVGIALRGDRGHGYATDAARTLARYAFEELGLHRLSAATAEHNAAARRALEKVGFRPEGRQREALYTGGRRWDRLLYGLLASEFAPDGALPAIDRSV
jgi:RimJ/RimL family protein N-acetyltransferase